MLSKFWESIGSNLAKRWIEYIFGPAFLFWAGGFGIFIWKTGWQETLTKLQNLTKIQQGVGILFFLLLLVFSSLILSALRFPILRILEGYWPWPFHYLGLGVVELRKKFFKKKYERLRKLKAKEEELSLKEQQKLTELDTWAHWRPAQAEALLPTTAARKLTHRLSRSAQFSGTHGGIMVLGSAIFNLDSLDDMGTSGRFALDDSGIWDGPPNCYDIWESY
jgi:hypothetical protein